MRDYALEELVLADRLAEQAHRLPGKTFLRFRGGELTFAELEDLARRVARGLHDAGVRPGDPVALLLPNGPEILIAVFALAKLGAVSVPVNTAYKKDLLSHALATSGARALVVDEVRLPRVAEVAEELPDLGRVWVHAPEGEGPPRRALRANARPFRSLLDAPPEPPEHRGRFSDLQGIVFTSGTTGPSKGVEIPHAHALTDALDWIRHTAFQPDETIYCPLPLFHGGALWDGVFSALLVGAEIAVVERFSASRFWDDVRRFRAHVALGIFSIIPILLSRPERPDDRDHALRCFYLGRSAQDRDLRERFGVRSVETYASTEVGIATGSPYGEWRPGSCGRENRRTYRVAVVNEADRELPPGEPGELVVRPVTPFAITTGYHGFPEATARAFRNLWFHTGDRVYRDEEGWFHFVDRLTDTIRRRGENVSSFDVERAVLSHRAVGDAAAFGVPSELDEDDVKICVVPREGAAVEPEEVVRHAAERLPYFMVPRYMEVVEDLPRSALGKVRKTELRKSGVTAATWDREAAGVEPERD